MSLIYFFPTLIEIAGLPQSNYINYLLNLRNIIPVLSRSTSFYDYTGTNFIYKSDNPYDKLIGDYFNLEYYIINHSADVRSFYNSR